MARQRAARKSQASWQQGPAVVLDESSGTATRLERDPFATLLYIQLRHHPLSSSRATCQLELQPQPSRDLLQTKMTRGEHMRITCWLQYFETHRTTFDLFNLNLYSRRDIDLFQARPQYFGAGIQKRGARVVPVHPRGIFSFVES